MIAHEIQPSLLQAINDPMCGIHIYWGISGAGKTAYAVWLARELKKAKRQVLFLDPKIFSNNTSTAILRKFCQLLPNRERAFQLNPTEPPPTTIIMDDLDTVWDNTKDINRLRNTIKLLAKQSSMSKTFNLLLIMSSAEHTMEMLGWDEFRIHLIDTVGIWNDVQVDALFTQQHANAPDKDKRRLFCVAAGTPGFVVWSTGKPLHRMKIVAEQTQQKWKDGLMKLQIGSTV